MAIENSVIDTHDAVLRNDDVSQVKRLVLDLTKQTLLGGNLNSHVQFHPLGFLSFKWKVNAHKGLRVHFWSKKFQWAQTPYWPVHDHIFSFQSQVLFGKLLNRRYFDAASAVDDSKAYPVHTTYYAGAESILESSSDFLRLKSARPEVFKEGDFYRIPELIFHRTKLLSENAITVLATQESQTKSRPRVVGARNNKTQVFDRSHQNLDQIPALLELHLHVLQSHLGKLGSDSN